jgi:hypothetical protein
MAAPRPDAGPHAGPDAGRDNDDAGIRRSYVLVVIVWVIQLAALYAFQAYFS